VAKPTISLPDGMLDEVDRRAAAAGVSRSAFIQEAIARYGADLDAEREQDARARRIGDAMREIREIAERMPPGVDGTALIRRFRDAPLGGIADEDER